MCLSWPSGDDTVIPLFSAARLIEQGKRVLCLDGGNRFNSLVIARFARHRKAGPNYSEPTTTTDCGATAPLISEKWPLPMGVSLPFACARKIPMLGVPL